MIRNDESLMAAPCVLIVDDDDDLRGALAECPRDAGYKTAEASNGQAALEALEGMGDLPCLILLDFLMPVMNGEQLCEKLAAQHRLAPIPVIIVAGVRGHPVKGARGFIRKPVSCDVLLKVVAEYCGAL